MVDMIVLTRTAEAAHRITLTVTILVPGRLVYAVRRSIRGWHRRHQLLTEPRPARGHRNGIVRMRLIVVAESGPPIERGRRIVGTGAQLVQTVDHLQVVRLHVYEP